MPKFFLIENVKGILDEKFSLVFNNFISLLCEVGYDVKYRLLDAVDYEVPQNRERVFIIGFRHNLGINYSFPLPSTGMHLTLKDIIGDLEYSAVPCGEGEKFHNINSYYSGCFSSYYNRSNRRRSWSMPSFTIHATGINTPLHPSSPCMIYNGHEDWAFVNERLCEYRRLTVHECARIQTFPDSFEIKCDNILDAYKMIGNAVPVRMANILAKSIMESIQKTAVERQSTRGDIKLDDRILVGYYKGYSHWKIITHQGFYYVRADGREGAMNINDLQPQPRLLLLHSRDRIHLYELTDIEPEFFSKDYLERLGFQPSGARYIGIGFDPSSRYNLKLLGININNINIERRFTPYITTFNDLKKKEIICH